MKVWSNRVSGLNFLFSLLLLWSLNAETSWGAEMLTTTGTVHIKAERIADVGGALSRVFQVPVCVEESRWFGREGDSAQSTKELKLKRDTGFEIVATNTPLESVLEQFVQRYPDYQWTYDKTSCVINLFPKRNVPADWHIKGVNIATQSLETILFTNDVIGLKERGIRFHPGRGNWSWAESRHITINGQDMCVRNVLNQICRQLPEPRYWVIRELQKPGVLWGRTGQVVLYDLAFHPYIPFDPSKKCPRPP